MDHWYGDDSSFHDFWLPDAVSLDLDAFDRQWKSERNPYFDTHVTAIDGTTEIMPLRDDGGSSVGIFLGDDALDAIRPGEFEKFGTTCLWGEADAELSYKLANDVWAFRELKWL